MALAIVDGPTIPHGESLSDGADCTGGTIVRITVPQEFTPANLTFQVSSDGGSYNDLYAPNGNEVTLSVKPDTTIFLDERWTRSIGWIKFRSGRASHLWCRPRMLAGLVSRSRFQTLKRARRLIWSAYRPKAKRRFDAAHYDGLRLAAYGRPGRHWRQRACGQWLCAAGSGDVRQCGKQPNGCFEQCGPHLSGRNGRLGYYHAFRALGRGGGGEFPRLRCAHGLEDHRQWRHRAVCRWRINHHRTMNVVSSRDIPRFRSRDHGCKRQCNLQRADDGAWRAIYGRNWGDHHRTS